MADIYFSDKSPTGELPPLNRPPENKRGKKHKNKMSRFLKGLIALITVFAISVSAFIGYTYFTLCSVDFNPQGHKENVYLDGKTLWSDNKVTNILFIGVDARIENTASRSDSMILFSIDRNNKKVKLTSFLRDTWVDIPGSGSAKLNASCTYGGAQLVIDTIEYNFNVRIDHYVLVDFDAFQNIIDQLDGIEVAITEKEAKVMREEYFFKTQAGSNVHLNGNEALWYSRIRYLDSDFMRTKCQRNVVEAIIKKSIDKKPWEVLPILNSVLPEVETDMSPALLTKYAFGAALFYRHYEVQQARIPADGTWQNATKRKQAMLLADLGKNQQYIYDFLYTPGKEETTTGSQNN